MRRWDKGDDFIEYCIQEGVQRAATESEGVGVKVIEGGFNQADCEESDRRHIAVRYR